MSSQDFRGLKKTAWCCNTSHRWSSEQKYREKNGEVNELLPQWLISWCCSRSIMTSKPTSPHVKVQSHYREYCLFTIANVKLIFWSATISSFHSHSDRHARLPMGRKRPRDDSNRLKCHQRPITSIELEWCLMSSPRHSLFVRFRLHACHRDMIFLTGKIISWNTNSSTLKRDSGLAHRRVSC